MKITYLLISCLMLSGILSAQIEVEYYDNSNRVFHLNKIDGKPYFGKNSTDLDFNISANDSQIYSFNGIDFEMKLTLNDINDSLNHAFLFDLWQNGDKIIVFSLSISNHTNQKYLTALEYDYNLIDIIKIKLFPVEKMRLPFGHQRLQIDEKTSWYFLEFDKINKEGKSLVRVNYGNGIVNWDRVYFDKGTVGLSLDDIYWDENKEIVVLNTSNNLRKFLVFDTEFNFLYSGHQNSNFQGISYKNPTTIILGGQQGNYTILERFIHDGGFILIKREMTLNSDNIWVSDDYSYLFPEDNSYFLQKYQKEGYTIFHYSKSSLDFSSNSFGYRIIFFDKHGNLEKQFEIQEESSIVLGFLHFYDNNTIAYGNGEWLYPGFSDPFIIEINLDTTTSTEDIWQEASVPLLRSNLIIDGQLVFNDDELDLKRISVYGISGRQMIQGLSANGDISFLAAGHYILFYDGAEGVVTERFVKVE